MAEKVLMTGNDVVGESAIRAGCRFYAGYPITPQNELTAYFARRMPEVGGTFIQSESELAAINMVFGAAVAGARAMTSSSSPGISLKQEGISYLAGCELPAVIVNVCRGGPGLGNIAPSQADYFQATRGGGHGDYHCLVLAPAGLTETAELTVLAFDLADRYRNPVLILTDGILGQMMEPAVLPEWRKEFPAKPWALTGCRGRPAQKIRSLLLNEGDLEKLNERLQKKYAEMGKNEIRFSASHLDDAELVLAAFGTSSRVCQAAMERAREKKLPVGMIRPISLYPFPYDSIRRQAEKSKGFLVVEMNCGQMVEDVRLAVEGRAPVAFYGRPGGGVPDEEAVLAEIEKCLKRAKRPKK